MQCLWEAGKRPSWWRSPVSQRVRDASQALTDPLELSPGKQPGSIRFFCHHTWVGGALMLLAKRLHVRGRLLRAFLPPYAFAHALQLLSSGTIYDP